MPPLIAGGGPSLSSSVQTWVASKSPRTAPVGIRRPGPLRTCRARYCSGLRRAWRRCCRRASWSGIPPVGADAPGYPDGDAQRDSLKPGLDHDPSTPLRSRNRPPAVNKKQMNETGTSAWPNRSNHYASGSSGSKPAPVRSALFEARARLPKTRHKCPTLHAYSQKNEVCPPGPTCATRGHEKADSWGRGVAGAAPERGPRMRPPRRGHPVHRR